MSGRGDLGPASVRMSLVARRWSADPALDVFREGIAALFLNGVLAGHVATIVEPMWAPFRRQERVWLLVTWANGRRDRIGEDYEPWTYVRELRDDHLVWPSDEGEVDFEARWLEGQERETAWHRFGITDDPGAYMGEWLIHLSAGSLKEGSVKHNTWHDVAYVQRTIATGQGPPADPR